MDRSSTHVHFRVMSPRKINARVRALLQILQLPEESVALLKYKPPADFEAEPSNCHFNVWVQWDKCGGKPQHGWLIGEDAVHDFAEAQFHTVWCSPQGELVDVTPRLDLEKRVMFVPDLQRCVQLIHRNGSPALRTYDNVRIHRGQLLSGIEIIELVPQSDLIYKHGLATRSALAASTRSCVL